MADVDKVVEVKEVVKEPEMKQPGIADAIAPKAERIELEIQEEKPEPKTEEPKKPEAKEEVSEPSKSPGPLPLKSDVEGTEVGNAKDWESDSNPAVKGIIAERKKRQEAQAQLLQAQKELEELKAQGMNPSVDETQIENHVENKMKSKILAISEGSARQAHPDYQEKYEAFQSAVFDGDQVNRALYESVLNSDHPGEAAYAAGKMILFQKEHGSDLDSQVKSIEQKAIAREREKLRKEVEAEFQGKVQTKQKQPTNLFSTRSAGSSSEEPFIQPSMADLLEIKRRKY